MKLHQGTWPDPSRRGRRTVTAKTPSVRLVVTPHQCGALRCARRPCSRLSAHLRHLWPRAASHGVTARLQLDGGIRLGGRLNWPRRGGGLLLAPHRARKNGWVMAVPVQFLMGSGLHVLCAIVMQHALTEQSSCPPRDGGGCAAYWWSNPVHLRVHRGA